MREMLSAHFALEELVRSQLAERLGIDNTPGEEELVELKKLCGVLEFVRERLGGGPLVISSGFRSKRLNMATPGAVSTSAHMRGMAADFHAPGKSALELTHEVLLALHSPGAPPFDQLIFEFDSWTHLSTDPRSRGQVLTKRFGSPYEVGIVPRKEKKG